MNSGIKSFCLKPFMVSQDQVYIISPYLLAKVKILNRQRRKAHASCWYTTCVCFPSRKKELQTRPVEIIYLPSNKLSVYQCCLDNLLKVHMVTGSYQNFTQRSDNELKIMADMNLASQAKNGLLLFQLCFLRWLVLLGSRCKTDQWEFYQWWNLTKKVTLI